MTIAMTPTAIGFGSGTCWPESPLPLTVAKLRLPSQVRCTKNALRVKVSRMIASTAARDGSVCAPTTAKKISVESTPWLPPSTSGLPKSAMLSIKPIRKALARPGAISGSDTRR